MKPIRLSLQAFGPFAGREEIDFGLLPPGALFLIAGATGAGKTSILDGITYALYGDTSGGERSASEMRSHHAEPALPTEVAFEFALGARRFLVRRLPEQERAAQRGSGMVKATAKAELAEWKAGAWQPLAQRTTEVGERIEALLGFKADQFRQVVVLPQGQFRRLLAASSAEREKILEALFGTVAYKRLQDALKAAAAALRQRAEEASLRRETLLGQAGADSAETLGGRRAQLGEVLAGLQAEEKGVREEDAAARAALQQGQAAAAQFAEAARARQALAAQEARQAGLAEARARLAFARRALQVLPAEAAREAAARDAAEARRREAEAVAEAVRAAEVRREAATRLASETARAPERETAQREQLRLEALVEAVARLAQAEAERSARENERLAAAQALAAASARSEQLGRERGALLARIDALQPIAARVDTLAMQLRQAERRVRATAELAQIARQLGDRRAEAQRLGEAVAHAQQALQARRTTQAALEQRWRQVQAAILAGHLHDGAACPVCGSASHPAPARFEGELPTEEALQAAADAARAAEAALEAARRAQGDAEHTAAGIEAEHRTRAAALAAEAGEAGEAGEVDTADLPALRAALAAARGALAELEPARGRLPTVDAGLAAAASACEAARLRAGEAASAAHGAARLTEERSAAVPAALRQPAALATAIAAARRLRLGLECALEQTQAAHQLAARHEAEACARRDARIEARVAAERRLAEADAAFLAALAAAGFGAAAASAGEGGAVTVSAVPETAGEGGMASADEAAQAAYRAALLEPAAIEARERALREADEALAAARERAVRAAEAVAGRTPPALEVREARATAGREAVEAVLGRIADARGEAAKLDHTLALLAGLARESGAIEAEYAVVGHLAEVANGDNGRRLTFQRYVLAALLDDVLRAASLRLKAMSRGRYLLQRRDDVADARRAAGLDLEVVDDYTGRARPASTLSGGEGFLASLSLALGLSDVVQAYAGGVQLDTLFIDEGFGSLDPESLDMAMKALIDLQQRGRMVGVISHVEEMKQQIDVAIEVVQGVRGSKVRILG